MLRRRKRESETIGLFTKVHLCLSLCLMPFMVSGPRFVGLQEFNLIVLNIILRRSAFSIAASSEHSEIFQPSYSGNLLSPGFTFKLKCPGPPLLILDTPLFSAVDIEILSKSSSLLFLPLVQTGNIPCKQTL